MTDLSRQVAEAMGWKSVLHMACSKVFNIPCPPLNIDLCYDSALLRNYDMCPHRKMIASDPPDYANDLNLAMEFDQKVMKKQCHLSIKREGFGYEVCYSRIEEDPTQQCQWITVNFRAQHNNLAAAICKAGMRALGKEGG
jgi:hypothetical protein